MSACRHFVLALASLLLLSACGGGSTPPPGDTRSDPDAFAGKWHAFFLRGFDNGGQLGHLASSSGRLDAEEGIITTTLTENENGIINAPVPITLLTYTVATDLTMEWHFPAVSPDVSWRGAISADRNFAVLASVRPGSDPEIVVLFRTTTGADDTLLRGRYHHSYFFGSANGNSPQHNAFMGEAEFDSPGAPLVTFSNIWNRDGVIIPPAPVGPWIDSGTYAVALNGATTYAILRAGEQHGALFAGGELLLLGANSLDDRPPSLRALIRKQDSLASVSTLEEQYYVVGFRHAADTQAYRSVLGQLVLNGAGGGTMTYEENVNRVIGADRVDDVAYQLFPDGRLHMRLDGRCEGGGTCLLGASLRSGAFAVLASGDADGIDPGMYFLMAR